MVWNLEHPTARDAQCKYRIESSRRGAFFQSYLPIVGCGKNAATLHYNKNNAPMERPTDLVLVDAGAEYNCYASDITRTFPVGGKFTPEAAKIYTIVLDMQKVTLSLSFSVAADK